MNKYAMVGLSAVLALGACSQPETADQASSAETIEAEATAGRTVEIHVTGMR